jgi:hypothetical protein
MSKILYIMVVSVLAILIITGCEDERVLTANTHDGRVPDVLDFRAVIDSSKANTSKYILRLLWRYDTLRYPTNPNIKNWEVYRVVANDTLTFKFQLQKFVQIPSYADSSISIQPAGRDSVVVLYRIIPIGNVVDNIQFTGRPSEIVRVVVRKK